MGWRQGTLSAYSGASASSTPLASRRSRGGCPVPCGALGARVHGADVRAPIARALAQLYAEKAALSGARFGFEGKVDPEIIARVFDRLEEYVEAR